MCAGLASCVLVYMLLCVGVYVDVCVCVLVSALFGQLVIGLRLRQQKPLAEACRMLTFFEVLQHNF